MEPCGDRAKDDIIRRKIGPRLEEELMEWESEQNSCTLAPSVEEGLHIELILQEIFKRLPIKDLLTCGLVSKKWNDLSRSVLRNSRMCMMYIKKCQPCMDLKVVNDILEVSTNIPFNGLSISLKNWDHDCLEEHQPLDLIKLYQTLLTKLTLRHLEINWVDETECPAMDLCKLILKERSGTLRTLEIFRLPPGMASICDYIGLEVSRRVGWLPNLTSLELPLVVDPDLLDEIVIAAPKLEKLFGTVTPDMLGILLGRNKAWTVKDFDLQQQEDSQLTLCHNFALQQPKLRRMSAFTNFEPSRLEVNAGIFKSLLHTSSSSLVEMDISHSNLILLAHLGILPLKNLRVLRLGYIHQLDKLEGYSTLRRIDLDRLFPSVTTIEILEEELEGGNLPPSLPFISQEFREASHLDLPCRNAKKLVLSAPFDNFEDGLWVEIARTFPNVTEFQMAGCSEVKRYLGFLWTTWPQIESITLLGINAADLQENFDAVFTGISEEDTQALYVNRQDFEEVQVDLVAPSILDLTNLKQFRMEILHLKPCDSSGNSMPFLTHLITYLLAHRPHLDFQIARRSCSPQGTPSSISPSCHFHLDHLKPRVRFTFATRWE